MGTRTIPEEFFFVCDKCGKELQFDGDRREIHCPPEWCNLTIELDTAEREALNFLLLCKECSKPILDVLDSVKEVTK